MGAKFSLRKARVELIKGICFEIGMTLIKPMRVGCAAFLHNVIIVLRIIMPHYVKKLGRKNYRRKSRSVRIIVSIIVTVIFLGALARSGNRKRDVIISTMFRVRS